MKCKSEPETKLEKIFSDFLRLSALVFVGCRADKKVHEGARNCGGCDGCDESQNDLSNPSIGQVSPGEVTQQTFVYK